MPVVRSACLQQMSSTFCKIVRSISHILLWATVLRTLSGCVIESPVAKREINQQEAISTAIAIAALSIPEISGSEVAPYNIHAEKMTLEEAVKRLNPSAPEEYLNTTVWLVTMDGLWLPATVPGVDQKPYKHLSIVLDAKTGLEIFRNIGR